MDGRDIFGERFGVDDSQQVEIAFHRCPVREGDEGRMESEAEFAESAHDVKKIFARVALVECAEDDIVEILDGADDEEAACLFELGQMRFVFSQVLDFYGDVVG